MTVGVPPTEQRHLHPPRSVWMLKAVVVGLSLCAGVGFLLALFGSIFLPDTLQGYSRAKILGAAVRGYAADVSVAEAVRRSNALRQDAATVNLTLKIGKIIRSKTGATAIDEAPDVWYAFQPAHAQSCADAELVAGVWTCGVRRLQCEVA